MLPFYCFPVLANKVASPLSNSHSDGGDPRFSNLRQPSVSTGDSRVDLGLPSYDISDPAPVPALIMELIKTFFAHLGCNFPFLRRDKVLRMVDEKRIAPILVDAICALAARFSDNQQLAGSQGAKRLKSEYGQVFAQRAKAAVTDSFLCPTVEALQACLLLAYEAFGDNKDSALWMYTGCAIRMAFDLGLEKLDGIRIQGDRGPNYSPIDGDTVHRGTGGRSEEASLEQKASEQERIDTLWAIFTLDRFISSGLGRPATMRREDFELQLPVITKDPKTDWPAPLPALIQIIHMYGRVSDLLNGIKSEEDVTEVRLQGLANMEDEMMMLYHDLDPKLTFKPEHFQHYVKVGEGTNFILLHFWFHTLIMVVHCPMLWNTAITQLLPNNSGREYSMSSAKTIADILSFAEILDPKSFIGNPFTSQPMYFAASAFLIESNIHKVSLPVSREGSPHRGTKPTNKASAAVSAKHTSSYYHRRQAETKQQTLHAFQAANENYQRCYKALEQLETYWAGTKYILTALNQKATGITDPETFTTEEMESTKVRPGPLHDWKRRIPTTLLSPGMKSVALSMSPKTERSASPMVEGGTTQPICWSLTGTTNSPSSNLTWMYQPQTGDAASPAPAPAPSPAAAHKFYDPIRSSVPGPIRVTGATATATTTYSSYNMTYPPLHPPMHPPLHPPQHPQQQMPMPHNMPGPTQKYGNNMDEPPALSDAKMLLELQHSPHPYNRVTPTPYGTASSQQPSTEAAHHMQQGLYDGSERYDFATTGAGASDMAYQGWAMSGFIGTGLGISGAGTGDLMLSTREIDMYNLDHEMLTWVGDVEYLPQDTMMSFDTAANMNRYGNG